MEKVLEMKMHDLSGKKVLVFGGAGFVGSQLVRNLLTHGSKVIVYDNFIHGTEENLEEIKTDIEIVVGDVLEPWQLSQVFKDHKPEYVFDLVAETYVPTAYSAMRRTLTTNIEGTLNILSTAHQFDVKRLLYVSTTELYGNARTEKISEDHQIDPFNTYAVTKMVADRLCFTMHKEHGIPLVIARFFNSYGPRETEPYVIPDIISQFAKQSWVELGNVEARRDFTYVEESAEALIQLIESDIPDGEAVNVGSGITYSVKELASRIAGIMGKPADIRVDPKRFRKYDIDVFSADITKLKKYTGWEPKIDIDSGLRMTIDWYKMHGEKWSWEKWAKGKVEGGDGRRR